MNQPVITLDAALRALASANTPDELVTLANQAAALQVYARRAKLGMAAQNRCAEIRLRAERKLGQLLATTDRLHGRPKSVPRENTFPRLADLGIPDRKISHRAQRIAAIGDREFEAYLRDAQRAGWEITTRQLLLVAERQEAAQAWNPTSRSRRMSSRRAQDEGLFVGDCLDVLASRDEASTNLIVTSPPYADARQATYGGVPPDEYVEWFMARAEEFRRILTPDGSLVIDIKEGTDWGERSTYVIELILAMRRAGWLWIEEYVWHKRTSVPGKWPNRFRDAWERCLHFTLNREFAMYQDAVMVPVGEWATQRLANLSEADRKREPSASGSPFSRNISNWLGRDMAYPTNVLHFATECGFVGHPAAFPEELPEFFVKLFTREGDVVCDPFMGSGTTGVVCARLNRRFIGIDIMEKNVRLTERRVRQARMSAAALAGD